MRLRMLDSDPLAATAGAVARLTGGGMERHAAIQVVARIMREEQHSAR